MNLVLKYPAQPATLPATAEPDEQGDLGSARVPHISIHVYHDSEEFAAVWRRAEADRRLASATPALRAGGFQAAIQTYAAERSPDLIIVETKAEEDRLVYLVDSLAELCQPETRLIVVGWRNDIQLFRRLLDMGVSNYLVAPVGVAPVIRAITGIYVDEGRHKLGHVSAVLGAKGGVGTSTVAESLALELSRRRASDVLLIDFDLAFGTTGLDLDIAPNQGLTELLRDPNRIDVDMLDRLTVRRGDHLTVLGTTSSVENGCEIEEGAVERVIEVAQSHVRHIVIDLPHLWAPWIERSLIAADDVLVVATPELASLRNAVSVIARVKALRPNDPPPRMVLNQVGMPRRQEITTRDIAQVLEIEPAVSIPFDAKTFSRAAARGKMAIELSARGALAQAFGKLAALADPEQATARRKRRWFLGRRGKAGG